ncbi:MAG: LysR family transcriptional regulator [Betaproteobacteria bacterium]
MKISGRQVNLEFTQIELMAALGEARSLSSAAIAIGLSQSAASHALARLRRELGDPLLVRTSNGMKATPYGDAAFRAAQQSLKALRQGLETAESFDAATSERSFAMHMSDIGQTVFLPPLLAHIGKAAPGVRLRVSPLPPYQPSALLESGEVDLAVGYFTTLKAGFRQRLLFTERYVCVTRADHPRFAKGMTLEAFHEVPHAVTTASGSGHKILDRILQQHHSHLRVMLQVPHFLVLPFVIANSDLMVIVPSQLAEAFTLLAPLLVMEPPIPIPRYDIRMFWHERFHADPANRWLRETCLVSLQRRPTSVTLKTSQAADAASTAGVAAAIRAGSR